MSERGSVGFFDTMVDRTIGRLRSAWRDIAGQTRSPGAPTRPELTSDFSSRAWYSLDSS